MVLWLALIFAIGCDKKEPVSTQSSSRQSAPPQPAASAPGRGSAAVPVSAEKTSFQEVTSQLEPGGNFYMYLGTEQWLEGLSGKVSRLGGFIDAIPGLTAEQSGTMVKIFGLVTNLIRSSGLEEISGLGMSSIAREKGLYHSKLVVHHYKEKGAGFIWNLFGRKAHPLEGLNLLSTNTAVAGFWDLDLPLLWSVIRKQAAESGFAEAEQFLNQLPEKFQQGTGLSLDKVLASLAGEFGVVLTLDTSKKITVPLPTSSPLEVPSPGLVFVIKAKDETIFNRVDEALGQLPQQVIKVDKPNLKMRTVPVPLPLPIELRPTLASSEGYLFVATSDSLIQEMLGVKSGQIPGLSSTDEFRRLAKDSPSQGNSFSFVSRRFSEGIMNVQRQALSMSGNVPPGINQLVGTFLDPEKANYSYSVGANTEQGWVTTSTGNQNPATVLATVGVIVPIAVLSAVAVPAFAKARQKAQTVSCRNNLKQIDLAKHLWANDNNKPESATPTRAELLPFLSKSQFPICPAGGEYSMNPVNEHAQCTIPGHTLDDQ